MRQTHINELTFMQEECQYRGEGVFAVRRIYDFMVNTFFIDHPASLKTLTLDSESIGKIEPILKNNDTLMVMGKEDTLYKAIFYSEGKEVIRLEGYMLNDPYYN